MTNCLARPDRFGTMRCTACRVSWEADDVAACPRQAPPVMPLEMPLRCASSDAADAVGFAFASGLAALNANGEPLGWDRSVYSSTTGKWSHTYETRK